MQGINVAGKDCIDLFMYSWLSLTYTNIRNVEMKTFAYKFYIHTYTLGYL